MEADKKRHKVFARLRVLPAGDVQLLLKPLVASVNAPKPEPCTLEQLQLQLGGLQDCDFSDTERRLTGVRLCHRQRFGNFLHFYGFRSVRGTLIEAIMRRGVISHDDDERLSAVCALGDSVTITGLVEKSKGRLSIHARLVEVDESFAATFGARTLFRDDSPSMRADGVPLHWPVCAPSSPVGWACGLAKPAVPPVEPILLIQCVASHTARLQEYVRVAHGVSALAIVAPISGHKMGRDERCLAYRPMASAARLVVDLLGDMLMARYVQRWYLLEGRAPTLHEAVGALIERRIAMCDAKASAEAAAGGGGGSNGGAGSHAHMPMRVQAFPRVLEAIAVEQVRRSGRVAPEPRSGALGSVAYMLNAFYYGLSALDDERTSRAGGGLARPRCPAAEHAEDAASARNGANRVAAALAARSPSLVASHVCRAYYKLHEAQARFGLELQVRRRQGP